MLQVGTQRFRSTDGKDLIFIEADNVDNTEIPTPTNVSYRQRWVVPPYDESTENAAVYCRIDHRPGETDFRYGLYAEITEQSLVGGSFIKVVHRGAGDAQYIALIGDNTSGYGQEVAMFGGWQDPPTNSIPKQENGFLASLQGSGPFQESIKNQANTVGFHWLVHDDGVDPTDPDPWATNFGGFYANNSLSNAFVVRVSEFALNFPQFKVMDHTVNQRPHWAVFSDGQMFFYGLEADVSNQNRPSKTITQRNYYWDGSDEQAYDFLYQAGISGAPTPTPIQSFSFQEVIDGVPQPESTVLILSPSGIDFQTKDLSNVGTLTFETASGTGLDLQTKDVVNVNSITFIGAGTGLDLQTKNLTNVGTLTFETAVGTGLDLQTKDAININSITLTIGTGTGIDLQGKDVVGIGAVNTDTLVAVEGIGVWNTVAPVSQPSPIADVPTAGSATAAGNADAINSILSVLRSYGLIDT